MLYIVATPIGNLEDISQRALRILNECDAIFCEDTRRTALLLTHYHLKKPLLSFHQFNEAKKIESIIARLESGQTLALVSDAGTPCIQDPGLRLVAACIKRKIPLTTIPGPCSLIAALVLSGFDTDRFQYVGFLPKKPKPVLYRSLFYPGTTIAFESPDRLIQTLKILETLDSKRCIAVAREMTKMFEECRQGSAPELLSYFSKKLPKGEIVLLISAGAPPGITLGLEECVDLLQEIHGLNLKEAIRHAAVLLKISKSTVYKKVHFCPSKKSTR